MNNQQTHFNQFFANYLNKEQQEAVSQTNGVLLVIAGAGSGKTRVITSRIVNLMINHAVAPEQILALTFTNKAAKEMQERIHSFLPWDLFPKKPFIGTFHSYCLNLLRTNAHHTGFDNFSILDADDQQKIIQNLIKRNGLEKQISVKNVGYQISMHKNSIGMSDKNYIAEPLVTDLYQAYEREKTLSKCLDFDDLLVEVYKLFEKNSAFKEQFQKTVKHILVDEYQDTNVIQHALLKHMALQSEKKLSVDSLCVVGDEDQSIYSWRGATVSNILNFHKDFKQITTIKIEQNYRSVQPILNIANKVIANNRNRNAKTLWSDKEATDRVRVLTCVSGYQEGEAIALFIKATATKQSLSSVAILYRAHYQSRIIEEALIRHSIAYRIISGIQFYERKEIKDLLSYLRLIANPFDRVAFFRVINTPTRGLGKKFEEQVEEAWEKEPLLTYNEICTHLIEHEHLTTSKKTELKEFLNILKNMQSSDKPSQCLEEIIKKTGYCSYLTNSFDKVEAESKIENVKELLRAVIYIENQGTNTVARFLHEVALMQEKTSKNTSTDQVQLMTLHAAKGLEFDTIILNGLEEGLFPSSHALNSPETLEEERRLFYVGITRAKERLFLLNSRFRSTYGTMTDQMPSRFLREIPDSLAQCHDGSYWSTTQIASFFEQWLKTTRPSDVLTFNQPTKKISAPARPAPQESVTTTNTTTAQWRLHQTVNHKTFGIGIIKLIENKPDSSVFITAQFKDGVKKIKSSFLETV